jgi:hypothetical protein
MARGVLTFADDDDGGHDACTAAGLLISNAALAPASLRLVSTNLPWNGAARVTVRVVDDTRSFTEASGVTARDDIVELSLGRSSVVLVTWRMR